MQRLRCWSTLSYITTVSLREIEAFLQRILEEIQQIIDVHYRGKAQMLTTVTEENSLKLRGDPWNFESRPSNALASDQLRISRQQSIKGAESDAGTHVAAQLVNLVAVTREVAHAINIEQPNRNVCAKLLTQLKQAQSETEKLLRSIAQILAQPLSPDVGMRITNTSPAFWLDTIFS